MWRAVVPFAAVLGVCVAAGSCQDLPTGIPCMSIPDGGCPIDRGGTCDDVTCDAVYSCDDAVWSIAQKCPARDAGTSGDGGASHGPCTGGDGGTCTPVTIDTSGEAVDCTPALDATQGDCPVDVAHDSCAECVCLSGCSDFYFCKPNPIAGVDRGWVHVAYCTDQGTFTLDGP